MKVGIFGGTFDPIHEGHIAIAKEAAAQYGFDFVLVMPARIPPHKQSLGITADLHRVAMTELSLLDEKMLRVDLSEFARPGVSYTYETLTQLEQEHPGTEWHYIMGEDSLEQFPQWYHPEKIAGMAKILVAIRSDDEGSYRALLAERNAQYNNAFSVIRHTYNDVSSTKLRECLRSGESTGQIAPAALDYAVRFGVYTGRPTILRESTVEYCSEVRERLAGVLSAHRLSHCEGVAVTAANILFEHLTRSGRAPKEDGFYDEVQQAYIAGLLHDCAKYMRDSENVAFCDAHGVSCTQDEAKCPDVLHANIGAYIAASDYGVEDPVILAAIDEHCLGDESMDDVSTAVYVADYIEPFRTHEPIAIPMVELRKLALEDLHEAAYRVADATIRFLQHVGFSICDKSYSVREALKNRVGL